MRKRLSRIAGMLLVIMAMSITPATPAAHAAHTSGTCYSGTRYGDAGTSHNYVQFHVLACATKWHIEREWWAFYPADLWAYPDGNGNTKAGIHGTDQNPPYPASGYRICTG